MKLPLLLLALLWVSGASCLFAKSELETLRSLCAEQERQIHQLEEDNAKLRSPSNLTTARSADKPAAALPAAVPAPAAGSTSAKAGKTYAVKDGETFTSIGKKFGISAAALIAANPDVKPSSMRPGRVIHLVAPTPLPDAANEAPVKKPSADNHKTAVKPSASIPKATPVAEATPPVAPKTTPPPAPMPKAPAKPLVASAIPTPEPASVKKTGESKPASPTLAKPNFRTIAIEGNSTYGEFAAKHGTTVSRLNELNSLDLVAGTALAKGMELNVPVQP